MTDFAKLETRTGLKLNVRPVTEEDEALVADFFRHVSKDDLRFRFLSGMPGVPASEIHAMTHVDHRQTEDFLAFDDGDGRLVATAMLGCDAAMKRAEVAIAIREGCKNQGIGWELLRHVARVAEDRGIETIESVESRENHAAIELEKEMGFVAEPVEDDVSLVLVRKVLIAA